MQACGWTKPVLLRDETYHCHIHIGFVQCTSCNDIYNGLHFQVNLSLPILLPMYILKYYWGFFFMFSWKTGEGEYQKASQPGKAGGNHGSYWRSNAHDIFQRECHWVALDKQAHGDYWAGTFYEYSKAGRYRKRISYACSKLLQLVMLHHFTGRTYSPFL